MSYSLILLDQMLRAENEQHAERIEAIYQSFYDRGLLPRVERPENPKIELDAADKEIRG